MLNSVNCGGRGEKLYLNSLCSSVISDSGCSPTHALKTLIKAALCLARALMTGVPGGVNGACVALDKASSQ